MKRPPRPVPPLRQRGASLVVVLVALLLIAFASIALLRSTDTSTLVAGNLGFQKAALASGDAATEAAIAWLGTQAGTGTLNADIPASGYYSTSGYGCDLTGNRTPTNATDDVNWASASGNANCGQYGLTVTPTPAGVAPGYTVAYIINRMCNAAGDPNSTTAADGVTPMSCSHYEGGSTDNSTKSGGYYGNTPLSGTQETYYRITTRITGPRNTVRYVQAFVVF